MHDDAWWMRRALGWAQLAAERGDVPIGAVLAKDDELLAMAHDARELLADPTGHAELICLREGARKIGDWRLDGCTLYVTLEPCPMCAGAIVVMTAMCGRTSLVSAAISPAWFMPISRTATSLSAGIRARLSGTPKFCSNSESPSVPLRSNWCRRMSFFTVYLPPFLREAWSSCTK